MFVASRISTDSIKRKAHYVRTCSAVEFGVSHHGSISVSRYFICLILLLMKHKHVSLPIKKNKLNLFFIWLQISTLKTLCIFWLALGQSVILSLLWLEAKLVYYKYSFLFSTSFKKILKLIFF